MSAAERTPIGIGRVITPASPAMIAAMEAMDWRPLKRPADMPPGEMYATHVGDLALPGSPTVQVTRLNDGRYAMEYDELAKLYGARIDEVRP